MLIGALLGAVLVLPLPVAIVIGTAGIIGVGSRSRTVRPLGIVLLAGAAVMVGAPPDPSETRVGSLAPQVPLCDLSGVVAEHQGGLGTLVTVVRLECGEVADAGGLGTVVVDGRRGQIGGSMSATGRLVPLGDSGFDSGRRRAGAGAALDLHRATFGDPSSPARRLAARMRRGIADAAAAMDPRRGALLAGLTIGDTSGFDEETEARMRRAGLSHLVAVSGSNVAVVVGAAMLALRRAGRYLSVAVAAMTLLLYTFTVGPEPSVLRAATMGAIGLAAFASGRRIEPLAALGVALSIVIAARPQMIHSVGLQLSACATAGLILWTNSIAARLSRLPRPVALGLGATLAANVAVAPVLVAVFEELSLVSPVANLFAMAAVPPATILGLAAGSVAAMDPNIGGGLARITEPFCGWILAVGDLLGAPEAGVVKVPGILALVMAMPLVWAAFRSAHDASNRGPRRRGGLVS